MGPRQGTAPSPPHHKHPCKWKDVLVHINLWPHCPESSLHCQNTQSSIYVSINAALCILAVKAHRHFPNTYANPDRTSNYTDFPDARDVMPPSVPFPKQTPSFEEFGNCVRRARNGSAPGPNGIPTLFGSPVNLWNGASARFDRKSGPQVKPHPLGVKLWSCYFTNLVQVPFPETSGRLPCGTVRVNFSSPFYLNGACANTSLFTRFWVAFSHSVDLAGWQAKMAWIEIWIPWRNAQKPHLLPVTWSATSTLTRKHRKDLCQVCQAVSRTPTFHKKLFAMPGDIAARSVSHFLICTWLIWLSNHVTKKKK